MLVYGWVYKDELLEWRGDDVPSWNTCMCIDNNKLISIMFNKGLGVGVWFEGKVFNERIIIRWGIVIIGVGLIILC